MTRELATVITAVIVVLVIAGGIWAWRRRVGRDAHLVPPFGRPPHGATRIADFGGLYVATTRHNEPLERLAVRGLGFRARATMSRFDRGVALEIAGTEPIFVTEEQLVDIDQATVAIDRVVEPGGLVRMSWRIDQDTTVDSYFRPQSTSAHAVVTALHHPRTPGAAA